MSYSDHGEPFSYDDVAEWYDSVIRTGTIVQDAAVCAIEQMVTVTTGCRICDVGCGQGEVARMLATRGGKVVGLDTSAKLLDIARAAETRMPLGILYEKSDADSLVHWEPSRFDGAICNMAFMDIPDLEATSLGIARILRPGGWFVFTIMHPCFQTPDSEWVRGATVDTARLVRAYFDEGRWMSPHGTGMRSRVGAIHRTLSTYFNVLSRCGLILDAVREPRLARESRNDAPAYDAVPAILAARYVKPHDGT